MPSKEDRDLPPNEFSEQLRKITRTLKFESDMDFSFKDALKESRALYGDELSAQEKAAKAAMEEHRKTHPSDSEGGEEGDDEPQGV